MSRPFRKKVALDSLRRDADPRHVEIFEALVLQRRKPVDVAAAYAMSRNQVDGIKFRMLKRIRAIARRMWGELDEQ
ncbi:hypothetical protein RAS1_32360 [Phycisphaerae bacterium RAS1]|nr:hypothetical protein RAS1_32360 [Phycisphaerae bacterium RAS1]